MGPGRNERARLNADLVAGVAGGLFAPLASFGAGLPLWASLPGAVMVFLGIRLSLPKPSAGSRTMAGDAGDGAIDVVNEVTLIAREDLDRLERCAGAIRDKAVSAALLRLHGMARRVVVDVEKRPVRLNSVRRLLTYYLPSAVRLGEGLQVLETSYRPDAARIAATAGMINRLDDVFAHIADRVSDVEIDGLDIELKLLEDTLRNEEGGRVAPPPAPGR